MGGVGEWEWEMWVRVDVCRQGSIVHVCVFAHVYMCVCLRMCTCVFLCMCTCVCLCMCVHTIVLMCLARSAYLRVLQDSSKAELAGLMCAIMVVRQLPPRESYG